MEISVEQVIKEYENGTSLEEISKKIYKSIHMIKSELLLYGGKKGKKILLQELEKGFPMIKAMAQDYKKGKKVEQLSKQYNLTENKIREAIQQYKMITGETFSEKHITQYREDLQIDKIIEGYRKGETWSKLAKDNDASIDAIRNRVNQYIEKYGNQIEEERKKAIQEKKQQGLNQYRIQLPIEEIWYEHKVLKCSYAKIAEKYHVSSMAIRRRVKDYKAQKEEQKEYNADKENDEIKENKIDLPIIIKHFKSGYSLDEVQKIAEKSGYQINESDIEIARKIEKGELKVVTEASIEKIIEKYGYSYEELVEIGKKKGYVVLEDRYISAKANINNKNKEGEEK